MPHPQAAGSIIRSCPAPNQPLDHVSQLRTYAVPLVLGQLEPRPALARRAPLGRLSADVGTAVVLVHAVHPICAARERGRAEEEREKGRRGTVRQETREKDITLYKSTGPSETREIA